MTEANTISAPAINLVDESFDVKKFSNYHLAILISEKVVAYAILDTSSNKYLALHAEVENSPTLQTFEKMGNHFKSVTCAVAHNKFAVTPSALFEMENKNALLGFNHSIDASEKTHADALHNVDAKNLFTISRDLETTVKKQFPNTHFMHNSTAFIEGLLIKNKNNSGKKVFANFHDTYFEIVLLHGRELLFNNAFKYKTAEDIAYYILFVYEQLHLNPEEIELIITGAIEKTAKEHALLYNYIRHIKFGTRPDEFKYSYKFDEISSHNLYSLFTQYLCV